jgi:hypothetical protein
MIKIKWGRLVNNHNYPSYVSNTIIGKIFGIDGSSVRRLYLKRFDEWNNRRSITRKQSLILSQLPIR